MAATEETVLIACKAPNGLVLDLDRYEAVDPEGRVIRTVKGAKRVTLKGWAHAVTAPDPAAGTGGYVLTPVPASFWAEWIARNAGCSLLEDRIILPPHKDAVRQAVDHAAVPRQFGYADPKAVGGIESLTKD